MTEHTDHGGHEGEATAGEVQTWHLVPTAPAGTVPVEWSDLRAMRRRIDDLERERERLEARLEQSRERRRRTVERYERLLDRRPGTETTRPRVTGDDDGRPGRCRATAEDGNESDGPSTPTVAADGGVDGTVSGPGPRDERVSEDATARGPLSRLVAAVVGVVSRG